MDRVIAGAEPETATRGRGNWALIGALVLFAALALIPVIGAYQAARDYGFSTLVSLAAGATAFAGVALAWTLGGRLTDRK